MLSTSKPLSRFKGHIRQEWAQLGKAAISGEPRSILMVGLLVLTPSTLGTRSLYLVPFVAQGDRIFAIATAYVLAALIAGVMLGRIGYRQRSIGHGAKEST
jgi:hypothetical protein